MANLVDRVPPVKFRVCRHSAQSLMPRRRQNEVHGKAGTDAESGRSNAGADAEPGRSLPVANRYHMLTVMRGPACCMNALRGPWPNQVRTKHGPSGQDGHICELSLLRLMAHVSLRRLLQDMEIVHQLVNDGSAPDDALSFGERLPKAIKSLKAALPDQHARPVKPLSAKELKQQRVEGAMGDEALRQLVHQLIDKGIFCQSSNKASPWQARLQPGWPGISPAGGTDAAGAQEAMMALPPPSSTDPSVAHELPDVQQAGTAMLALALPGGSTSPSFPMVVGTNSTSTNHLPVMSLGSVGPLSTTSSFAVPSAFQAMVSKSFATALTENKDAISRIVENGVQTQLQPLLAVISASQVCCHSNPLLVAQTVYSPYTLGHPTC